MLKGINRMSDYRIIGLRFVNDPKYITTITGKTMAKCYGYGSHGLMGIVAFDDVAKELNECSKGDLVHIYGKLNTYIYLKDDEEVEELQIIAENVTF